MVGSKRPNASVSVCEIASASVPVKMRNPAVRDHGWARISNGAGQTSQTSHCAAWKGGTRSGLAARSIIGIDILL